MPQETQKLLVLKLQNVKAVFVHIDDILTVTKGTKSEQLEK